ncbi:MAG: hypothetical protein AB8C46_24030 [Burkholderiaceae bacterium]
MISYLKMTVFEMPKWFIRPIAAPCARLTVLVCFLWLAGCATSDHGASEQQRLAREAEKAALAQALEASRREQAAAQAPRPMLADSGAVPLQSAVRRMVPKIVGQAIEAQKGKAAPRAIVVMPARSVGLQPPNLGASGASAVAIAQLMKSRPDLTLIDQNPQRLPEADWAILMDVAFDDQDSLCVSVFDLNSSKVLAHGNQRITRASVNLVPTRYFRDLPVVLTWRDALPDTASCKPGQAAADQPVQRTDWRTYARLSLTFDQASRLYARRDHGRALIQFRSLRDQAMKAMSRGPKGDASLFKQIALHGQLGEYLSTWRMIFNRGAEHLMRPLVTALFEHDKALALNLSFSPLDGGIVAGRRMRSRQTEWLIEVSRYLRGLRACAEIVGHAGNDFAADATLEEPIGLQHAAYVRRQLRRHSKFSPADLSTRLPREDEGMPIPLSGDVQDEWARRVTIIKQDCNQKDN